MLEFHDISVRFGEKKALRRVSFALRPHRLTVLLGRNGSGKSTLLACVNQQVPYTGEILEGEKNLALLQHRERARTLTVLNTVQARQNIGGCVPRASPTLASSGLSARRGSSPTPARRAFSASPRLVALSLMTSTQIHICNRCS